MDASPADCRRWIVLGCYTLLSISSAQQWISYAPIVSQARRFFGLSAFQVDTMSLSYLVVYIVVAPLTCFSFHHLGFKGTLLLGATANALGAVLRLFAVLWFPTRYGWLLFFQCIAALGQFSILSTPPVLAELWFPSSQRTMANAIGCNSLNLGAAIGLLVPPLVVTPLHHSRDDFATLFGAIITSIAVAAFVGCLVIPTKPRIAAPAAVTFAAIAPSKENTTYGTDKIRGDPVGATADPTSVAAVMGAAKSAGRNRDFRLLSITAGVGVGSMWAFSTVYTQVFSPFGISEHWSGIMGFVNIFAGTVFAAGAGALVDRWKRFKAPLLGAMGVMLLSQVLMGVVFIFDHGSVLGLVFVLYLLMGLSQAVVGALGLELSAELTFPASPSISAGVIMGSASLISFALTVGVAALLGNEPSQRDATLALLIFVIFSAVATALLVPVRENLHRLAKERQQQGPTCAPCFLPAEDSSSLLQSP